MTHLDLSFLGPFKVTLNGEPVTGFASDKVRALLAYLAVEGHQPHRREALAGLLWPDSADAEAVASLRQTIFRLRNALGEGREPGVRGQESGVGDRESGVSTQEQVPAPDTGLPAPVLLVTQQTVHIDPSTYRLDVEEYSELLDACRSHRHRKIEFCSTCHARFCRAAELYRGDFLAGFHLQDSEAFDEWLILKREGLRRQALDVFENMATYHESRAEHEEALRYNYRQLEMEPWREEAHRHAMKLLALDGQRSAAIAQYETCRRVLREEFGIEPEAKTVTLYESIIAGDRGSGVGGQSTSQNILTADSPATPVPTHNLPQQLTPFIGREEELARIVELLNSPDYRLITLIGLGGVGKTRLAIRAAYEQVNAFDDGVRYVPLAAVGRPELMASSIAQAVGLRFGGSKQPEAQLLDFLRDKEMLLVLDNFEHLLGGAPGDDGDQFAGGTELLTSILKNTPKITMLVTSRERLNLHAEYILDLTGMVVPSVDDALASYDAVRLFVERAQRVQSGFALTADNAQGVLDICRLVEGLPLGIVLAAAWVRHFPTPSLAKSIKDNLDFLRTSSRDAPAHHSSLRAVFNHSWKLLQEGERQVLRKLSVFRGGWEEDAAENIAGAPVYSLLSLVDKSLLRREASGRFNIHEVVRQYATEQLQAVPVEQSETRAAHVAYFLDFAEQAEEKLWGPEADAWLTALDRELNNLRAALEWAFSASKGSKARTFQRLTGALWRFWYLRGHYKEGREHLMAALSGLRDLKVEPGYAARIYHGAGVLSVVVGDFAEATRLLEESLQLYRQVGDKARMAFALTAAGVAAHDQGDYARAGALYSESLDVNCEMGNKVGMLLALNNWGSVARDQGDYATAQELFKESLALARETGDKRGTALSLLSIGIVAWHQADSESSASLVQQSLGLHYEIGDKLGMSNCLDVLGRAATSQAVIDPSRAAVAAQLWGAAEALREAIGSPLPPADRADYDRSVAMARETLDQKAFEEAWAKGRATPIGEMVAYGLRKG